MAALDIAEVARRSGTPASALRWYEEKGLIESIGRRGLRRVFEPAVLERLALIRLGQHAGFTLEEIGSMFGGGGGGGGPSIDRAMLAAKADELDVLVRKLSAMRDGLRHAAACPAPRHMDCPKFRRILSKAVAAPRSRRKAEAGTPP